MSTASRPCRIDVKDGAEQTTFYALAVVTRFEERPPFGPKWDETQWTDPKVTSTGAASSGARLREKRSRQRPREGPMKAGSWRPARKS